MGMPDIEARLSRDGSQGRMLENKTAIVTGGAQGIGEAVVKRFCEEGAKGVVIADINSELGMATADKLKEEGYPVHFEQVDVADYESVATMVGRSALHLGGVDIFIGNAAITKDKSAIRMPIKWWDEVIAVNLSGVFYGIHEVLPIMKEAGYGRIVVASSIVGSAGNFGQSNYAATKAGLEGVVKTIHREVGKDGITINAIAPGFIDTDMIASVPQENIDQLVAQTSLRRLGRPEEVANAYAFLASDRASFITGTVLHVNGGLRV